ncbi:hypothetical protein ACWGM0_09395 [Sphingomonas bisphenolicum]
MAEAFNLSEASWSDTTKTPAIDWSISAGLENVARGGQDIAEVTNLDGAVRAWLALDQEHQKEARLTIEYPILLDGVAMSHFSGLTIAALAEHLPPETSRA